MTGLEQDTMRRLYKFEKRAEPLASREVFYGRLGRNARWALAVVAASLLIGTGGYRFFEGMAWIDAFANAAMILSGMGPLGTLSSTGGKLFASFYAIASGLLLFVIAGLMLLPVYHRILHHFHVDDEEDGQPPR
ncbi:MAG: hypothetical protein ACKOED_00555 [Aestuariivirga sp.]|uniref:hypothetical protein n=1 Tax=Aestuariivirga sp. TaxID=2650926 RepID=UPI0038CF31DB